MPLLTALPKEIILLIMLGTVIFPAILYVFASITHRSKLIWSGMGGVGSILVAIYSSSNFTCFGWINDYAFLLWLGLTIGFVLGAMALIDHWEIQPAKISKVTLLMPLPPGTPNKKNKPRK